MNKTLSTNNNIKVSVIVPVYNSEKLLNRCISSIRNQTLKEIEIICVNDCSTDNSLSILNNEVNEDNRIKVISNDKCLGAGISRNIGIDNARGEYLSFIDSDDYIDIDFHEKLYNRAKEKDLDIVKGLTVCENEEGEIIKIDTTMNNKIKTEIKKNTDLFLLFTSRHQTALYRRSLVVENNVYYGKSKRAQDTTFLLRVTACAKSFDLVDDAIYHYCDNNNSLVHTISKENLNGFLESFKDKIDYFISRDNLNKNSVIRYILDRITGICGEYYRYIKNNEDAQWYVEDLRDCLLKLPYYDELVDKSYTINVLENYKQLIPTSPFVLSWSKATTKQWSEIVKLNVDFINKYPEIKEESKNFFAIILKNSLACYRKDKDKYALKEINKSLNDLPLGMRLYVKAAAIISSYLPYSIKQFIKRFIKS